MQTHDSKRAPSLAIHPSIAQAVLSATVAQAEVRAAADYLAEAMKRIHGGNWRVSIDHMSQLVTISRNFIEPPAKPKPEVV
ncbi:MAG: hypothetical protein WA950_12515 [Shinella sp.]|uniref:hypothetical protein n=1 Tax=Shinella sp. TaxID=1870904 RepID=UPI003C708E51